MPFAVLLALAVCLSLVGTLLGLPQRVAQAAPARPDIVLIYLDDFAPYPASLWSHAGRTPELARFVDRGLEFEHAFVSTPLCGPSRANLLTGRYGHASGVIRNDIAAYDPRGTLGPMMRRAGYRTAFIGKHINRLADVYDSRARMRRLSAGWDRFDVIWERQGRYYGWRQYRKSATRRYGAAESDHSSWVAAERAVHHIRSTPAGEPLFLVLSLYDGHAPLKPLRRFEDHPACADLAGWSGGAYDEADVSDKPAYIRVKPRLAESAFDLVDRCEQLLTVDWVLGRVRQALEETARAGNTLQVLTSDNGSLMGDHRLFGKGPPYSAAVPLYMRWPAVLHNQKRIVREPVSNVDHAPTFCALAGCRIGRADGRSLVPLIRGTRSRLARDFLYLELLHGARGWGTDPGARPAWVSIVSTRRYSTTPWSYIRNRGGREELYDLSADPHQLENLAGRPAYAPVLRDMRSFKARVWKRHDVRWWR